ncbi:MAG: hypothetical protein K9N51_06225 [Candidatus Pacebacteria bacterium]|nr:hypothetical protein [Candidatus Paceibacterota bacterium]
MKAQDTDSLLQQASGWLPCADVPHNVVLASRVTLSRNVSHTPFPHKATPRQRESLFLLLKDRLEQLRFFEPKWSIETTGLDDVEKQFLLEQQLVTSEWCRMGKGTGLVIDPGKKISVMVNETNHLTLQSLCRGLDFSAGWQQLSQFDDELSTTVDIAFNRTLGYLTACPSNVGTGLQVSTILHMPALSLAGLVPAIRRASRELGLALRGVYSEALDNHGHIVELSNQTALGQTEGSLIEMVHRIAQQLAWTEENERWRLLQDKPETLYDLVGRAYGVLHYAGQLTRDEAMAGLSAIRLGVAIGLFSSLTLQTIDHLMLESQPGHLQRAAGSCLAEDKQNVLRADMIRKALRSMEPSRHHGGQRH